MSLIEPGIISEIAQRLEVPVQYIAETVTRAQPVLGLFMITSVIIWLAGTVIGFKKAKAWAEEQDFIFSEDKWASICIITFIVSFVLSLILVLIQGALVSIFMPEYSAIIEIAQMIS
ncbi:MAG: hypothetical protein ACOC1X_02030 [Promethearchaeota archaeon]